MKLEMRPKSVQSTTSHAFTNGKHRIELTLTTECDAETAYNLLVLWSKNTPVLVEQSFDADTGIFTSTISSAVPSV